MLSVYLVGFVLGVWQRKSRWWLASLTALLVFVITYLASWVEHGDALVLARLKHRVSLHHMGWICEELNQYHQTHGKYPDSLAELPNLRNRLLHSPSGEALDVWGHPFLYRRMAEGFELVSPGRDGQRGGVGLDADLVWGDPPTYTQTRLPWSQFLFDASANENVFPAAVVASLGIALIWLRSGIEFPISGKSAYVGLGCLLWTTLGAIVVAVSLAAEYVAISQSGH